MHTCGCALMMGHCIESAHGVVDNCFERQKERNPVG